MSGIKTRINENSIDLIVTSPPYWNLKDYGHEEQLGHGQTIEEYRESMREVFRECYRVLKEARRMVVNIRDRIVSNKHAADPKFRGNFEIIPLHSYIIQDMVDVGFKYVGVVLWQFVGGGGGQNEGALSTLGSYPYPPNAHVPATFEYVLIFRKKDVPKSRPNRRDDTTRARSKISKEMWLKYTNQIWRFPATRVPGHPAPFPTELPRRCITLWSFVGDTILDPFAGTGTVTRAAKELERNSIGFEINPSFRKIQEKRIGMYRNITTYIRRNNE